MKKKNRRLYGGYIFRFLDCSLFFILFPLYLIPVAHAQQFRVGLLGGIVTSQVDGDTYAGYDKLGWTGGGFVTKKITAGNKWSASFEILYIQKGSKKLPHPDRGDFSEYRLKLNYAEVPVLLKYHFFLPNWRLANSDSSGSPLINGNRKRGFALEAGIAFGKLVRSEEFDANGQVQGGIPFNKTEYSSIFGLNYFFSDRFSFNVRSQYSIFHIREITSSAPYYQNWTYKFLKPGYYNNLIVFSLRYQWGKGEK